MTEQCKKVIRLEIGTKFNGVCFCLADKGHDGACFYSIPLEEIRP